MKAIKLFFPFYFVFLGQAFSQSAPGKYFIKFTDKSNNSYSLHNPRQFLSERALERRERQNIKIDSLDLPVSPAYLAGLRNEGAKILHRSKWFNAATVEASPEIISKIEKLPYVSQVFQAPSYPIQKKKQDLTFEKIANNCELAGSSSEPYGSAFYQLKMINGDVLHCAGYTGEGMLIGVLDAGFFKVDELKAFQRLREKGKIIGTYDFVDGDTLLYDASSHGTSVLSIMGGHLKDKMIGTAPDASYLLIRTEDGGSEYRIEEDNWVAGAEFADSAGVDIINSSLGYTTFDDPVQNYSFKHMDGNTARVTIGANIAASRGILVVNSAGNAGNDEWQKIGAPADGYNVLAIGAVDFISKRAGFSSMGPSYDGRVKPDVTAMGQWTVIASFSDDGEVVTGNGTSFSAPIISGMAACLWQAFPYKKWEEIADAIRQSGHIAQEPDSLYGYGLPDFANAFQLLKGTEVIASEKKSSIAVYPNPFTDHLELNFRFSNSQDVLLEIFSYEGRQLLSKEFKALENSYGRVFINEVSGLPSGLYVLRIQAGETRVSQKLLKH